MESIFFDYESSDYWIEVPLQNSTQIFKTLFQIQLKSSKYFSELKETYQLTSSGLVHLDLKNRVTHITPTRCKLFQPFIEVQNSQETFGFKLGSQDFYLESQSELDESILHFRQVCILDTFEEDFVVIKELGRGSSSTVYLVEDLQTGKPFACKTFEKNSLIIKKSWVKNLIQEIEILTELDHPSIAQFHSVYESESSVVLIMEYLPFGDLYKRILTKKRFREEDVSKFARNLLEVLEFIHSKNIVHRDLKLENIMMTSHNDFSIKLIDFGLAYSSPLPQSQRCGSPGYIAPEVLSRAEYDHKIDLFSAGVVLFIISSGVHPFCASTPAKVLNVNVNCEVTCWNALKGLGKGLIMMMMTKDPESRPSASELLSHPFIYPSKRSSFSVNLVSTLTGSLGIDM